MARRILWLALACVTLQTPSGAAPRRIVSLTPGITEMLFAVGLGRRVVGDTIYCDYPPAAERIPKIGDLRVNYEKVVSLRPDLIVGDAVATPEADARLAQLHLPVLVVRPDSVLDVERSILQIGQRAGVMPQARAVVSRMQATRLEADALAGRDARHPRVLWVIGTGPLYVAGRGTFMDDILTEAGGVNAAPLTGYGTLSPEVALAHPPAVILASPADEAALRADPVLHLLPAVRAGRFISLQNGDLWDRPGPRIVDGLLKLARALNAGAK